MNGQNLDTPFTNSHCGWVLDSTSIHPQDFEYDIDGSYVSVDITRELERQLNLAQEEIRNLKSQLNEKNELGK